MLHLKYPIYDLKVLKFITDEFIRIRIKYMNQIQRELKLAEKAKNGEIDKNDCMDLRAKTKVLQFAAK